MYFYWIFYFASLVVVSAVCSVAVRLALKDYQIMRFVIFLNPQLDPQGSGWNILQSLTAIGSGGFHGKGFLHGTQSHYQFLPSQSTDFIFSIVSEEWGFLGGLLVLGLYLIILLRGLGIVWSVRADSFGYLVGAGVLSLLFVHLLINAGMAMGIMPVTGIPFLFLSYGGSSLWASLTSVGNSHEPLPSKAQVSRGIRRIVMRWMIPAVNPGHADPDAGFGAGQDRRGGLPRRRCFPREKWRRPCPRGVVIGVPIENFDLMKTGDDGNAQVRIISPRVPSSTVVVSADTQFTFELSTLQGRQRSSVNLISGSLSLKVSDVERSGRSRRTDGEHGAWRPGDGVHGLHLRFRRHPCNLQHGGGRLHGGERHRIPGGSRECR